VCVDLRIALLHNIVPPVHPRVFPSHLVKSGVRTDTPQGIRDDATCEWVVEQAAVHVWDVEAVVHGVQVPLQERDLVQCAMHEILVHVEDEPV
jgi:hypothetical protein